jgi:cob(I)alamin adenosyltransferase
MSIATTTGDLGQTSLADGRRVSKGDMRVETYGTVDELISQIGLARGLCQHEEAAAIAKELQLHLFAVAEALASHDLLIEIDPARVETLTSHIHRIERQDGILVDWAVAGEHAGAAAFDVARTVCRRAERVAVRLRDSGATMHPSVLAYLNRLSDLLWLLGRLVERDAGVNASLREPHHSDKRWSKAWK